MLRPIQVVVLVELFLFLSIGSSLGRADEAVTSELDPVAQQVTWLQKSIFSITDMAKDKNSVGLDKLRAFVGDARIVV